MRIFYAHLINYCKFFQSEQFNLITFTPKFVGPMDENFNY